MVGNFFIFCLFCCPIGILSISIFGFGKSYDDASLESYEQLQKILEDGNKRSKEIEKYTKELTIRQNQRNAAIASAANVMTPILASSMLDSEVPDLVNSASSMSIPNPSVPIDTSSSKSVLPVLIPKDERGSNSDNMLIAPKPNAPSTPPSEANDEEFLEKMRVQSQIAHIAMMSSEPSFVPNQGQVLFLRDTSASFRSPSLEITPDNSHLAANHMPTPYTIIESPFLELQRTRIAARPGKIEEEMEPRPQLPARDSRELI